jgi:FixJ family two-component response regulator
VLDVHLRGLSGFDLQDLLEASGRSIPIVFITAHDDAATRERVEQSGQVYLRKPVDENCLLGAITSLLNQSKS